MSLRRDSEETLIWTFEKYWTFEKWDSEEGITVFLLIGSTVVPCRITDLLVYLSGDEVWFKEMHLGVKLTRWNVVVKFECVNLTGLRAAYRISKVHFWVCLGRLWRQDLGYFIWSFVPSSLVLVPASLPSQRKLGIFALLPSSAVTFLPWSQLIKEWDLWNSEPN